jgi:hypothetical protein
MNLTSLIANRYIYQDIFGEDGYMWEMENLTSSTWTGMVGLLGHTNFWHSQNL